MFLSLVSKFDPRVKVLFVLLFTILVFVIDSLPVAAGLFLLFLLLRIAAKIPLGSMKSIFLLTLLVTFMILMQILFGPGENYILKPLFPPSFPVLGGMGSLKWDGLVLGLMIGCRLAALMLLLPLLTQTTSPGQIAAGLAGFRINYRAAFILSTAFNLIPLFEAEGRAIMDAQKLRGTRSFEEGSFIRKMKAYPTLVVPLVLGAMRKAQSASVAMDSRAFGVYKTRTWLEKPVMRVLDYFFLVLGFIVFVLILILNHFL